MLRPIRGTKSYNDPATSLEARRIQGQRACILATYRKRVRRAVPQAADTACCHGRTALYCALTALQTYRNWAITVYATANWATALAGSAQLGTCVC